MVNSQRGGVEAAGIFPNMMLNSDEIVDGEQRRWFPIEEKIQKTY